MPRIAIICALCLFQCVPGMARAETGSLFTGSAIAAPRGSVLSVRDDPAAQVIRASLFVGRTKGGLFADPPESAPAFAADPIPGMAGGDVVHIRNLIGQAESRRDGYDAVQHGARVRPAKLPTQMTLAEIYDWIDATPGQPHAIGRYQFIPATLRRVAGRIGAKPGARFSPALQDRLADVLLSEAGLHRFRAGELDRVAFMNNLAKIWAGLPTSSGKSHYDGFAGNRASMTWASFNAEMAKLTPATPSQRN